MAQVILEVARFYSREKFEYGTIQKAARDAIDWLDADMIWPVLIVEDGKEAWRQDGPFGDCIEKLRELANAGVTHNT